MQCYVNNHRLAQQEAGIGLNDLGLTRGVGIFDFFRTSNNKPLFIADHLSRLASGAEKVYGGLPVSIDELENRIYDLIGVNEMPVSGIRIILTGGYSPNSYSIKTPNLIITQEPISFPDVKLYDQGVKLITHDHLRGFPEIKTTNYMLGVLLQDKAESKGAYDILYMHNGLIHELTRSNFFIVNKKGQLITPKDNVLLGVTRKKTLQLATGLLEVIEADLSIDDMRDAQEAFLTGTTKRILPVTQVDEEFIGDGSPGAITRQLMKAFEEMESSYLRGD